MIESINKNLKVDKDIDLMLMDHMEELEEMLEYDCWRNHCSTNYTD